MKLVITIFLSVATTLAIAQYQSKSSGNWNNPSTWEGNVVPNSSTADIEILSGHTITLNTSVSVRNITITNGSLILGSNTIAIYGNLGGLQRNNMSSNTNTELQLLGGDEVAPFEFPANIEKLKKLVINRKQGAISYHSIDLDDGVPADGIVLVLTHGILYMYDASIVYLNSKQIQADIPCSDSSHIDGIVQRNIPKNSGVYTFPVGNKGFCRPFGVGLQNGNSDNINQVQFLYETPVQHDNINYNNLPGGIIQYFYWKHTVVSGGNPQRRLHYSYDDFPGVDSDERTESMTLANSDGSSAWDKATTPWTVNDNSKWVQFDNANASNSEYWTLGSVLSEINYENLHLPIELVTFWARLFDELRVELHWVTAQEVNNHYFVVYRSLNGIDFTPIDTIMSQGNSAEFSYYEYLDEVLFAETSILYYVLRQVDMNGDFTESHVIEVLLPQKQTQEIKPLDCKPLQGAIYIQIDTEQRPVSNIIVCDMQGNVHYELSDFSEMTSQFQVHIPVAGNKIYVVYIRYVDIYTSQRMMVR